MFLAVDIAVGGESTVPHIFAGLALYGWAGLPPLGVALFLIGLYNLFADEARKRALRDRRTGGSLSIYEIQDIYDARPTSILMIVALVLSALSGPSTLWICDGIFTAFLLLPLIGAKWARRANLLALIAVVGLLFYLTIELRVVPWTIDRIVVAWGRSQVLLLSGAIGIPVVLWLLARQNIDGFWSPILVSAIAGLVIAVVWAALVAWTGPWLWLVVTVLAFNILAVSLSDKRGLSWMIYLSYASLWLTILLFVARLVWGRRVLVTVRSATEHVLAFARGNVIPLFFAVGVIVIVVFSTGRRYCSGQCGGSGRVFVGSKSRRDPDDTPLVAHRQYGWDHINYYRTCPDCGGTGRRDGWIYSLGATILVGAIAWWYLR